MTTTPEFAGGVSSYHELHDEWERQIEALYEAAEFATRGRLLNARGRERRIDARSLFYGRKARAYAYASEELRVWWQTQSRLPWRTFAAQAMPRHACPTCGGVA